MVDYLSAFVRDEISQLKASMRMAKFAYWSTPKIGVAILISSAAFTLAGWAMFIIGMHDLACR